MAKIVEIASDRVLDIASRIRAACVALAEPEDRKFEAMEAAQGAANDGNNTRLSVITDIAAMSHAEEWTHAEVAQACERAAKMGNSADGEQSRSARSVGVFISEMKTFASPKVRGHLPDLRATCEAVWADETELLASVEREDRDAIETPVRKWQSRFYHLIMNVSRAVKEGKLTAPMSKDDLIAYAVANDPDHNATKVAARLKTLIGQIDGFHADFEMEELKIAADYLRTISTDELMAARKALVAARAALNPPPVWTPPVLVSPAPAPMEGAASQGGTTEGGDDGEVVSGVFDYEDDILGDGVARQQASQLVMAALVAA
jgi:hypothetical protein